MKILQSVPKRRAMPRAALKAAVGDKVRIKTQPHVGERGSVERTNGRSVVVRLDKDGDVARFAPSDFTNLSLAARKAWLSMPERRVGRPKGTKTRDRVSVTLRLDRQLWQTFREAEREGRISDRADAVNQSLKAYLERLR